MAYEIDTLRKKGVTFYHNVVVGRSLDIQDLFDEGYDAVFVGTGAGLPKFMNIEGENLVGVYSANEYLTRINLMKLPGRVRHSNQKAQAGCGCRRRKRCHGRSKMR